MCSSDGIGARSLDGRAQVQAVLSRASKALQGVRRTSRRALQSQPLDKDSQTSEEKVPLASESLPLPDEDSQLRAAILVSRTAAKEEDELRTFMEQQLAEALAASQATAAAAQEELTRLEAELQDALQASRLGTGAATESQASASCQCVASGEFEDELAAALAEVQTTLRAATRGPINLEIGEAQETKHATEVSGPVCFDMALAGSSQDTLQPTMLAGECSSPCVQGPDALDQWWAGLGVDGATLEFAGSAPGKSSVAVDVTSSQQSGLGSIGGA